MISINRLNPIAVLLTNTSQIKPNGYHLWVNGKEMNIQ